MHFYDAKLLRLRARTHIDPEARRADITAALARHRVRTRAALDDFELRGHAALINDARRISANNASAGTSTGAIQPL
jgi:hypothetical protein